MSLKYLVLGIATYLPWFDKIRASRAHTGGTDSARYCYSVWLRHLVNAYQKGVCTSYPNAVAELGPGDSIGIGLCALISGADVYYGLDVVKYANVDRNLEIFEALVELFRRKENIPDDQEFPKLKPLLDSYDFPSEILPDCHLEKCLNDNRIKEIRESIIAADRKDSKIKYVAPFHDKNVIKQESLDMLYSQAVLEHVENLHEIYDNMKHWLKPSGFISHQIDFKCHGLAREWNGHWTYSDLKWKLIKGRRPYLLNRQSLSQHMKFICQHFKVIGEVKITVGETRIQPKDLAPSFKHMSKADLSTSAAFFQAVKK
ncbi:MAG: hypothetical protein IH614_15715 [Desulfuromonadales bacterium]|nr:hypothetical protein [Desulfuromonadales bacterium]